MTLMVGLAVGYTAALLMPGRACAQRLRVCEAQLAARPIPVPTAEAFPCTAELDTVQAQVRPQPCPSQRPCARVTRPAAADRWIEHAARSWRLCEAGAVP